jgi:integrase
MKRQSFQQGTVTLRERAKGPAVWVIKYREDGQQKTKRLGTVEKLPTKAAAEKAANKLRKDINERRECVFVSDLLDRYEKEIDPEEKTDLPVRVVTADAYKSHMKRFREHWGKTRLDVLAKDMMGLEQWINSLKTFPTKNTAARPMAKKSRFNIKALIHLLFERAIFWGLLDLQRNPVELVKIKGKSGRTRPLVIVSNEAYHKMLNDPELQPHVRMMIMIAMCLGLRASEILGLRWTDFEHRDLTLNVRTSYVGKDEDETKTPESTEVIPLHSELADEIAMWKVKNVDHKTGDPHFEWMFASAITGRPYWRGILQQDHLEPAGNRAGIPGLGWHSFRHTYRSMLAELGESMEVQQRMMRHADIKTTMGYGDPKIDKQRRAASNNVYEMVKKRSA